MSEGFGTPGTRTEYQNMKLKYWYQDARRFANQQNLTLYGPKRAYDSTFAHIGGLWALEQSEEAFISYSKKVYHLFFHRKLELDDQNEIIRVLGEENIPNKDFIEYCNNTGKDKLVQIETIAKELSVFGVPTWVFDDGEYFFGQDRIHFVHDKLLQKNLAKKEYYQRRKQELEDELREVNSKL